MLAIAIASNALVGEDVMSTKIERRALDHGCMMHDACTVGMLATDRIGMMATHKVGMMAL